MGIIKTSVQYLVNPKKKGIPYYRYVSGGRGSICRKKKRGSAQGVDSKSWCDQDADTSVR